MDLRSYRHREKLTLDQMGELLGVSGVTIHRWERGKAVPSLRMAQLIERVSAGHVSVRDFMPADHAAADVSPQDAGMPA